jgi:hypothetical protein
LGIAKRKIKAFKTVSTPAGTSPVATIVADTLTLSSANSALTITGDSGAKTISFAVVVGNIAHQSLSGAGTNTHAQIDTHIADSSIHFSQGSISITSSQVSDFTESVQDVIGNPSFIGDSSTIDVTYNDGSNTYALAVIVGGIDHGLLGGLGDDDHTQYSILSNARGLQTFAGAITITGAFVNDGGGVFNSGVSSNDGLGGADSESYGLSATTSGLVNSLSIGPRSNNSAAATGNALAIGVDATTGDEGIAIGHQASSGGGSVSLGFEAVSTTFSFALGSFTSANLFDVVIGASATSVGVGNNVLIGATGAFSGSSNVGLGFGVNDGGFNNVRILGGGTATASNQFIVTAANNWFMGAPTGGTAVSAKTFQSSNRTGTNVANAGSITFRPGLGTGTGARSVLIFETPIVAAAGTTPHTYGERMRMTETALVINENALVHDVRMECSSDANLFMLVSSTSSVQIGSATQLNSAKFGVSGKFTCTGEAEIDGDFNHDGTNFGIHGVTPTARPAAYTQTYATATRTHANLTSSTLTDSTGGTANTTVQALPDPTDTPVTADNLRDDLVAVLIPALRNNFADVVAQINALRVDLENTKQVLNSTIDDEQLQGLKQ